MSSAVRLSDVVGLPVREQSGGRPGRVEDLTVLLDRPRPSAEHLLVRSGRTTRCLVPWTEVDEVTPAGVVLRTNHRSRSVDPSHLPLGTYEVMLRRDVLDTQVVDLHGQRLSRVSEVLLESTGGALDVVAVDLGAASVVRRLGLGFLVRKVPARAVEWKDLHLTSPRGHLVQMSTERSPFRTLDADALAELLPLLSPRRATDLIRAVDPAVAVSALRRSHPRTGHRLLRALSGSDRRRLAVAAGTEDSRVLADLGRAGPPLSARRFRRTAGWRLLRPPRAER